MAALGAGELGGKSRPMIDKREIIDTATALDGDEPEGGIVIRSYAYEEAFGDRCDTPPCRLENSPAMPS